MATLSKRKFVIAVVSTESVAKRDEFIKQLAKAAHEALFNEGGTLKYAVLTSRDVARETDIWVIEEYVRAQATTKHATSLTEYARYIDEAAFDHHMSLPSVNAMQVWLGENLGPKPPTMHILTYPSDSFQFTRQQVNKHTDPWIIIAKLNYMVGGVGTSLPYWQAVVDQGREEEVGTLVYGILKDEGTVERLFTMEAYESEAYLKDVHVKSDAIAASIRDTKHLRTGIEWSFLRLVAGFLHK
ncbi:uncharacterized protein VDAG_02113 [Verticillium dahliae VdLs.17]|uniref:ABM domain-containing protein n=2 Tax=Verticillium dahliae TaxID=27337 RepID=G2WUX2_VERDV|nr:uncharacterized protein VDAG_02113 [Verticillium dahliae VdLs.17]EGY20097.1 hypothetical protein VDAG_02113 [Verticillium dahliae VdLs.17]PNH30902.1 hypothetical protein BJF96_g5719 [Verticillium dahliae]